MSDTPTTSYEIVCTYILNGRNSRAYRSYGHMLVVDDWIKGELFDLRASERREILGQVLREREKPPYLEFHMRPLVEGRMPLWNGVGALAEQKELEGSYQGAWSPDNHAFPGDKMPLVDIPDAVSVVLVPQDEYEGGELLVDVRRLEEGPKTQLEDILKKTSSKITA